MELTKIAFIILQILVLVTALSIDAFAAGFAYGISKVKMPNLSIGIVSAVSAIMLLLSLGVGHLLASYVPAYLATEIGFLLLFVLGIVKLFDRSGKKEAQEADWDGDKVLSAPEAVSLGVALSIDSIAAGIGVGVATKEMIWAVPAAFVINYLMMLIGGKIGKVISDKIKANLFWVSGVLLIILAFWRLLK